MNFWLPWQYFERQYDLIIFFRLLVRQKFGNFSFWSYQTGMDGGGKFLRKTKD